MIDSELYHKIRSYGPDFTLRSVGWAMVSARLEGHSGVELERAGLNPLGDPAGELTADQILIADVPALVIKHIDRFGPEQDACPLGDGDDLLQTQIHIESSRTAKHTALQASYCSGCRL